MSSSSATNACPSPSDEVHRARRCGVELDGLDQPVGRRADPDVDDDVEQRPAGAVDVLGLAGRDVGEVHAADHAAGRDALVDLRDVQVEAQRLAEGVGLVGRGEPAAVVGEDLGSNTHAPAMASSVAFMSSIPPRP